MKPGLRQTASSIAKAKLHQIEERAHVEAVTGLHVTDAGLTLRPLFIVHCPRCVYKASARREGSAVRSLASHISTAHWPGWVTK